MIRVDIRPRATGKTHDLIERCARANGIIVCGSKAEAERIKNMAKDMKVDINEPNVFRPELLRGLAHHKLYIDNLDSIIQSLFPNHKIDTVTMSNSIYENRLEE